MLCHFKFTQSKQLLCHKKQHETTPPDWTGSVLIAPTSKNLIVCAHRAERCRPLIALIIQPVSTPTACAWLPRITSMIWAGFWSNIEMPRGLDENITVTVPLCGVWNSSRTGGVCILDGSGHGALGLKKEHGFSNAYIFGEEDILGSGRYVLIDFTTLSWISRALSWKTATETRGFIVQYSFEMHQDAR